MTVSVIVFCDADGPVGAAWYPMVAVEGCAVIEFGGAQIHSASPEHLDALAQVVAEARA